MPALTTNPNIMTGEKLIADVARALVSASSGPASGSTTTDHLPTALSALQKHARSYGFSSKQCDQLIRLAVLGRLRLPSTGNLLKAKGPRTSASLAVLRCVVPSPRAKVGRQGVLDILSCLGPSPGSDPAKEAGLYKPDLSDQNAGLLGPQRVKVDSKVQAAALKLLCVLLDSPALPLSMAATLYEGLEGEEQRAAQYSSLAGSLPSTYLTSAARSVLDKSFSVLFHFIDYQVLRPHLCYLLCRLTKRRHVKHYRIAKLMALRANSAPEPGFSALLSTFANFYPDLLFPELLGGAGGSGSTAMGTGSVQGLKYPDTDWIGKVLQAHARSTRRSNGELVESDDEEDSTAAGAKARGRPSKRAKLDQDDPSNLKEGTTSVPIAIPNLVTIQPLNSAQKAFGTNPSLVTELSSLRHLAHSLDRLVLPSQVAALLGSSFGARLMRVAVLAGATISNEDSLSQSVPSRSRDRTAEQDLCWARLSDWLESVLGDELGVSRTHEKPATLSIPTTDAGFKRLAGLLKRSKNIFDLADGMPARLEGLLGSVLMSLASVAADEMDASASTNAQAIWTEDWDRLTLEVLRLVPLIQPQEWSEFDRLFLAPLETIAMSSQVSIQTSAHIVGSISLLLANWGSRNWLSIGKQLDSRRPYRWGISALVPEFDYVELISSTASRVDRMASNLLGLYPRHVGLEHAGLSLYEVMFSTLAGLHSTARMPSIPFYAFSFHATSVMTISRLCGLIQELRSSFEQYEIDSHPRPSSSSKSGGLEASVNQIRSAFYAEDNLGTLNSNVTLLANLIWLGKIVAGEFMPGALLPGFSDETLAELVERGDALNLKLATLAGTSHSRALSNLSERFANLYCMKQNATLARQEGWIRGPITPKTLKAAKRNGIPASWTHTDFRARLLDWIDREGAQGLYELLKNILVTLGSQLKKIREEENAKLAQSTQTTV